MTTISQQLRKIENDILTVLKENPKLKMTQVDLFKKTKLRNMAEYGWSFALDNLEKANKIKVVGHIYNGELQYQGV